MGEQRLFVWARMKGRAKAQGGVDSGLGIWQGTNAWGPVLNYPRGPNSSPVASPGGGNRPAAAFIRSPPHSAPGNHRKDTPGEQGPERSAAQTAVPRKSRDHTSRGGAAAPVPDPPRGSAIEGSEQWGRAGGSRPDSAPECSRSVSQISAAAFKQGAVPRHVGKARPGLSAYSPEICSPSIWWGLQGSSARSANIPTAPERIFVRF